MSAPMLATKLYIPSPRPQVVLRPRLIARLNDGLRQNHGFGRKLTLISAPAGFGKTTLVSEWVSLRDDGERKPEKVSAAGPPSASSRPPFRVAWLSLDEGDNDPARFLTYLVAALQTLAPQVGAGVLAALQSPQFPPVEPLLTALLNELAAIADHFVLVLDDYHVIDAKAVDQALAYLLMHLPPQMHLIIATREDPPLPLARLRAQGQLTELRAADLRFTAGEAAEFLNRVMALRLTAGDIAALETRTEGWIAGLQLAALALQGLAQHGQPDPAPFIQSFTGSHQFVMDYLVEEVLHQQPESVQAFLLRTSILGRLCAPLCEAVLLDPSVSGQETLAYLERANLFIVPLDNERRWYRYHHLFADLLRQRLRQSLASLAGQAESQMRALHLRASQWYEDNGLQLEAFRHAAAAGDVERAERLIDSRGIPLHLSSGVTPILDWLESLPKDVLNARPSLWWRHAAMLLINGQTIGVEEKLLAAEAALPDAAADDQTRALVGQIAAARATLALTRYDVAGMLAQSLRALEFLRPSQRFLRANAHWSLGYAHLLQGDRAAARRAWMESIALSQASGAVFTTILATIGLGNVQEVDNQLYPAAETYRRVVQLAGDHPQQIVHEAHLGLGRVLYEWNELEAAEQHGRQALALARQYEQVIDRFILCEVFLARVRLAQGDVDGAAALLAQADQSARQRNFVLRLPEIAAAQVPVLLRQGQRLAAAERAQAHALPLSQARVHLAQGDPAAALAVLEPWRRQAEARAWEDERLKAMVLQAVALQAQGEKKKAGHRLGDALALAEPGGFIRLFVDEGAPMAELLSRLKDAGGRQKEYLAKLLAAFGGQEAPGLPSFVRPLIEPLSQRELEVLQLMAQGLSNHEISERLFLALSTVKGHNQRIFDKLQVQRRTEAIARARDLGLV